MFKFVTEFIGREGEAFFRGECIKEIVHICIVKECAVTVCFKEFTEIEGVVNGGVVFEGDAVT